VHYPAAVTSALDAAVHWCAQTEGDLPAARRLIKLFPVHLNHVVWACTSTDPGYDFAAADSPGREVLAELLKQPNAHLMPDCNHHEALLNLEKTTVLDIKDMLGAAGVSEANQRSFCARVVRSGAPITFSSLGRRAREEFDRVLETGSGAEFRNYLAGLDAGRQNGLCDAILGSSGNAMYHAGVALRLEQLCAHDFIARLRVRDHVKRRMEWWGYVLSMTIKGDPVCDTPDFYEGVDLTALFSVPRPVPRQRELNGTTIVINDKVLRCFTVIPGQVPESMVASAKAAAGDVCSFVHYPAPLTSALDATVHWCAQTQGDLPSALRLIGRIPAYLNNVSWACTSTGPGYDFGAADSPGRAVVLQMLKSPTAHISPINALDGRPIIGRFTPQSIDRMLMGAGVPDADRRAFVKRTNP
jgi:hypothetical protein